MALTLEPDCTLADYRECYARIGLTTLLQDATYGFAMTRAQALSVRWLVIRDGNDELGIVQVLEKSALGGAIDADSAMQRARPLLRWRAGLLRAERLEAEGRLRFDWPRPATVIADLVQRHVAHREQAGFRGMESAQLHRLLVGLAYDDAAGAVALGGHSSLYTPGLQRYKAGMCGCALQLIGMYG